MRRKAKANVASAKKKKNDKRATVRIHILFFSWGRHRTMYLKFHRAWVLSDAFSYFASRNVNAGQEEGGRNGSRRGCR